MKRNQYPTTCIDCHRRVPAGHGVAIKVGPKWSASCVALTPHEYRGSGEPCDAVKDAALEGDL